MHCVTRPDELLQLAQQLQGASTFFIDTEFDSSRQGTRLSLVQLRASADDGEATAGDDRGAKTHLIDALQLGTLEPLAAVLGATNAQWVVHAGLQDVQLLCASLGLDDPPEIFDTQVAWGLLTPESGVSLAYLEYRLLGVRKMKTHQADDWLRRPLPRLQLEYAAADVQTLPTLETELTRRARALGRREIILAASRASCVPELEEAEPLSLRSFRNAWQLEPLNQRALQRLIVWHNREQAHAPLAAKTYLSIASRLPTTLDDLFRIKGVPRALRPPQARALLECLRASSDRSDAELVDLDPPAYATYREIQVEAQLIMLRAKLCTELECAPDLALPNRILKRMEAVVVEKGDWLAAQGCLTGWRAQLLDATLHAALQHQNELEA